MHLMKHHLSLCLMALVLTGTPSLGLSQGYEDRLKVMDVRHYHFDITLSDSSETIQGLADVSLSLLHSTPSITLDLVAVDETGKGMHVEEVKWQGQELEFQHRNHHLEVILPEEIRSPSTFQLQVRYAGIPADGLIITDSDVDGRSFFGDNWPDRAHHWLPVVDHPADKATVGFTVMAPAHYQIVSNGTLVEQKVLPNGSQVSRWENDEPLPTKVMVIGAADFSVETVGSVGDVPVSTWVFRKDEKNGFHDYAQGKAILEWFVRQVGEYPWDKLANVQSRTRYGGMENASCIFYAENSVTGDGSCEALMAHEIAHQWFGNSASEADWYHVWLSEGFATYWTHVYFEQVHGQEAFLQRMKQDRAAIVEWAPTKVWALVDPRIPTLESLLNTNSYQKGSWVLHMLRHRLGDEVFFRGVKEYYSRFKFGNALTHHLQKALEDVSGQDLSQFFQQWVFTAGHPMLDVAWSWSKGKKTVSLELRQTPVGKAFTFPLDIAFLDAEGRLIAEKTMQVTPNSQKVKFTLDRMPHQVELDPQVRLLFQGEVRKK